jgi:hypothetical protein
MIWVLTICTQSWLFCGMVTKYEYPSEQQCYRALNELYERHGSLEFKYVTCSPKQDETLDKEPT